MKRIMAWLGYVPTTDLEYARAQRVVAEARQDAAEAEVVMYKRRIAEVERQRDAWKARAEKPITAPKPDPEADTLPVWM